MAGGRCRADDSGFAAAYNLPPATYPPPMLLGFHHAQITVPPGRSDEVRAFYGGLLGLRELDLPPGFAAYRLIWFALGEHHQLHVSVDPDKPPVQTGMAHLAFESRGVGDWRSKLEAAGVETIDQPSMPGYDRFHVLDPFGNRLEFIEPTE